MINTLIVEDDFRVAEIHTAYVSNIPGFKVVGTAHNGTEAYDLVVEKKPHLVLLDLYLPDEHGLALFARLQQLPRGSKTDVFIISAARDVASIREALQLGATQYIMKPFNQRQLAERLLAYKAARERLDTGSEISQDEVDRLSALMRGPRLSQQAANIPKNPTTTTILKYIQDLADAVSANQVSDELGLSRATAQRYLSQMVDNGQLELTLQYGSTGRPIHLFRIAKRV
ncbi:MAG: response regulator [Actinomycetes bacterium]